MRLMRPPGGPPSGPQNPLQQLNAVNIPQINPKMHPDAIRGCSDISPFLDNTYLPNIVDTAIHGSADNSSAEHCVVLQSQYDIYSNGKTSTIHVEAPEFVPQSMAAHVNTTVPVEVPQETSDSGNASVNDKPQTANISNVSQTEHAPVVNKVGIPLHHSQGRGEPVTVSVPKTTKITSDDQNNVSAENTVKHVVTSLVREGTPEEHIMPPTLTEMEAKVQLEAETKLQQHRLPTPQFNPNMNSSHQWMYPVIAPHRQQLHGTTYPNDTMYYGPNDAKRRTSSILSQGRLQAPKQERTNKKIQILDPATGKDLMEHIIYSSEHTTFGTLSVVSQAIDSSATSSQSGPAETVLATSPPNVIAAEFAAKVAAKLSTSSTSSSTNTHTQQQRPPSNTSGAAQQQDINREPGPPQIMIQHMMGNNIRGSSPAHNIPADQSQPMMRHIMPSGGPPLGPQNPLQQSNPVNIPQINPNMHPDAIRGRSDISPFLDTTYLPNIVDTAIHGFADKSSANPSANLQSKYAIYSNGKTSTIHVEAPVFVPQSMAVHVNPTLPVQVLQDTSDSGNVSVNGKPQTTNVSNVSQTKHAPVGNTGCMPPPPPKERGEPFTVSVRKTTERTGDDQENVCAEATVKHEVTRLVREGALEVHIMSLTSVEKEAKVQLEAEPKLQHQRLHTPTFKPNMNSSNQGMYQSIAAKRHQMSGPPFHNATMYFGPNAQRRPSLKPSQGGPQAPNQERNKKKIQIFDPATGKDLMEDIIHSSEHTTSGTSYVVSQANDLSAISSHSGPAETVLATSPPNVIAAEFTAKVAAKLSTSSTSSTTNTQTKQQMPPFNPSAAGQQHHIKMEAGPPQIIMQQRIGNNIRSSSPAHNIPAYQSQPMMRPMMPPGRTPPGPQNTLQQSNPVNIPQINLNVHPGAVCGRPDITPVPSSTHLSNNVDTSIHGFADTSSASLNVALQSQSASLSNGKTCIIQVEAPVFVPQSMAVHVNPTLPVQVVQDTSDSSNVSVNDKSQTTNISNVSRTEHAPVVSKEGMSPHCGEKVTASVQKTTEITSDNQENVSAETTVKPELTSVVREGTPEVHIMQPTPVEKEAKVELVAVTKDTEVSVYSLPVEILRMDTQSIELYKQILTEGKEAVHTIRVMVVGQFDVGKTALTKRLLGKHVDIQTRDSTNGIDVHIRRCKVSLKDGKWTVLKQDDKSENTYKRLANLIAKQELNKHSGDQPELNMPDDSIEDESNMDVIPINTHGVIQTEINTQAPDTFDDLEMANPDEQAGTSSKKRRKRFQCQHCDKSYCRRSLLAFHITNTHENSTRKTLCLVCRKRFSTVYNLKLHQNIVHMNIRKHECQVCKMRFSLRKDLAGHQLQKGHGVPGASSSKHRCENCTKDFSYKRSLVRHLATCGKPVRMTMVCEQCPKRFNTNGALDNHVRAKHGEKLNICEYCGKSFDWKSSHVRHLKTVHKNDLG